jgi:predicted dienelactone hydrolase
LSGAEGELADLVDAKRVAVVGHSQGALSTLQSGGAQLDFGPCVANPDSFADDSSCREFLFHQEEIAAEWGLPSAPSGMWPQIHDPRVDAVVAMAPEADVWGAEYEGIASVEIPALLMIGSGDSVISAQEVTTAYEHLGSAEKALIIFENADHTIFMNACEVTPWFPEFTSFRVCSDAVWDMQRAHDLINHFTTAFLLSRLKDDAEAGAALSPEEMDFPGIDYQAEGL